MQSPNNEKSGGKAATGQVRQAVIDWFEKAVLGLNLCPFAHKPHRDQSIRFELSLATSDELCLQDVFEQLQLLQRHPEIETIVLIVPHHLHKFSQYLDFLDLGEALLEQQHWDGTFQIASFHPDYCFDGVEPDARENWTNRAPYPLLHLLREDSLSRVIERNDVSAIPEHNIDTLNALSAAQMDAIFGQRWRNKLDD